MNWLRLIVCWSLLLTCAALDLPSNADLSVHQLVIEYVQAQSGTYNVTIDENSSTQLNLSQTLQQCIGSLSSSSNQPVSVSFASLPSTVRGSLDTVSAALYLLSSFGVRQQRLSSAPFTVSDAKSQLLLIEPRQYTVGGPLLQFQYTSNASTSTVCRVALTVQPVNNAPLAAPSTYTLLVNESTVSPATLSVQIDLFAYQPQPLDNRSLTVSLTSLPSNGKLYAFNASLSNSQGAAITDPNSIVSVTNNGGSVSLLYQTTVDSSLNKLSLTFDAFAIVVDDGELQSITQPPTQLTVQLLSSDTAPVAPATASNVSVPMNYGSAISLPFDSVESRSVVWNASTVIGATITSLPTRGALYQVSSDGTQLIDQRIDSVPTRLSNQRLVWFQPEPDTFDSFAYTQFNYSLSSPLRSGAGADGTVFVTVRQDASTPASADQILPSLTRSDLLILLTMTQAQSNSAALYVQLLTLPVYGSLRQSDSSLPITSLPASLTDIDSASSTSRLVYSPSTSEPSYMTQSSTASSTPPLKHAV